ncbi:hypothetical protein SULI_01225 [Saccharolobus solfataricus]|uniref:Uncharacterized protein n=3 Tax=Saccharolobus solfataricus TaxID=2287 RepID=Q97W03_SACS2|nr:hypothetical protein [Saccharolobus solfataricus]AAK42587.1 Hypothetical protein SSO2445 [Saccharolobus solfataricus P2]AKA72679.1 hypothetical protein SULB_0242 [Saccharolobus solfataricus]AKA75379.1 hypothetical protein SULC_0241 [Saccharolobus solfataricus]AKA78070.1 hypothetical protein SULA_0241 [Saccharolobus solfataricus]AZF67192.1 hypothetical protein SULG_01225 [Saccharolobus solfataricus]
MKIKLKSLVRVIGEEELAVIPLAENEYYVECLNFYEDVEGGRQARLVVVVDKYGIIRQDQVNFIKGKKTFVDAIGVEDDFRKINSVLKLDRVARMFKVPLYFDIEIVEKPDVSKRGIRGLYNYLSVHKEIDIGKLRGLVNLSIEELV